MDKFWGIVYSQVDKSDVVLEVVDARFPSICRSNRLEKYVLDSDSTNLIIAINKTDLIPRERLDQWISWFKDQGLAAVGVSAKERLGTSRIRQTILRASKRKTAVVAVVGFPNTGKSSLINTLRGKSAAGVAPIPGKTRSEQKVRVSNSLFMFDTPGVIPAKLPEKHKILLGIVSITKLQDPEHAALVLYHQGNQLNPGAIAKYYEIEDNEEELLEILAVKFNKYRKGKVPNEREAAMIILKDHVRGRLPIFEVPDNPLRLK